MHVYPSGRVTKFRPLSLKIVNVSEPLVAVALPTMVPSNVDCALTSMFQVNVNPDEGKSAPEEEVIRINTDSPRLQTKSTYYSLSLVPMSCCR